MVRKFIKVQCANREHHVIPIDQIKYISPKTENGFKSKTVLLDNAQCYSTNTQSEIYEMIIRENRKP